MAPIIVRKGFFTAKAHAQTAAIGERGGGTEQFVAPAAGHAKGAGAFLPDFERGAHRRGGVFRAGETGVLAGDGVFTLVQLFVRRGDGG